MDETISFFLLAFVALIVGIVSFSFGFFRHKIQEFTPQISGLSAFTGIFIFFFSQLLFFPFLLFSFFYFYPVKLSADMRSWLAIFSTFFSSSITLAYFYTLPKGIRTEIMGRWWGKRRKPLKNFFIGLGSWFICFPFVIVSVILVKLILGQFFTIPNIQQLPVQDLIRVRHHLPLFTTLSLIVVVIIPMVEELLFRGMLQTWLRGRLHWKWAVLVTALIFATLHLSASHGMRNVEFFTGIFVLSLFLGYLNEKYGSLWAPIGLHIAFNGVSTLVLVIEIP
ncbi:MAG: CPBP family intramembrane glutamic endopeptidase [Waddliaceae bacterium]